NAVSSLFSELTIVVTIKWLKANKSPTTVEDSQFIRAPATLDGLFVCRKPRSAVQLQESALYFFGGIGGVV
ncbi:MAG: hypothetical protein OXI86_04175, partial [Candidatus Poribacteria bacterium]|nr:hypothetical protein [Candidatus Poribacteria bacterium]